MEFTRRQFLVAVSGTAVGTLAAGCAIGRDQPRRKPNVVVMLCDDLGYGDLGCYGHPVIKTPFLDRFAGEGIRFTDCYAAAPVCSPSRAGMITGRNPYRCNIPDWIPESSPIHLRRDEVGVAKLLREAGYRTGHCGKWHLSGTLDGSQPTPAYHGFEHWFSTQNNAHPSHRNPDNFMRNGAPVGPLQGYSSTLIVGEAIRFLEERGDDPFALFVWFHSPHEPVATAPEFKEKYVAEPDETKRIYYGNVTQMDYEVGRLLKALDDRGLRDDTMVMFTSDNGPETLNRYKGARHSHGSPGPLRGMKLHMYEGGIRVPGMIRWPGRTKPGAECREPINGTDVLPTLCSLANADPPRDRALDGASLTPVFAGRSIRRARPLYWRYDRALSPAKVAMRRGDWKILADANLEGQELYNLRDDPGETRNLAAVERERLASLAEELRAIHTEIEQEGAARGGRA